MPGLLVTALIAHIDNIIICVKSNTRRIRTYGNCFRHAICRTVYNRDKLGIMICRIYVTVDRVICEKYGVWQI